MEQERELEQFLVRSAGEIGLSLAQDQIAQFMCYLSHLTHWNQTINLTSITDPFEIVIKHFIDSLAALTVTEFSAGSLVADVGSGGGLPGIPLKIMKRDLRLELIEPGKKKCSFLTSLIGLLRLHDVNIFSGTLSQYAAAAGRGLIDIILLRALRFDDVQDEVVELLAPRGRVVLYRAKPLALKDVGKEFHIVQERSYSLPHGGGERVISVLSKKEK